MRERGVLSTADADTTPDEEKPPATPRWVKVFLGVVVVIIVAATLLLLGGNHGPGRHADDLRGGMPPVAGGASVHDA
jgi:hypothetical protein